MSPIKFRAWDMDSKQIYNWDSIKQLFNEHLEHERVVVMQYTGHKDKNGKEIYEGDIIRILHPFKGRSYTGPIVYEGFRFTAKGFYFTHQDDPYDPLEGPEYIEIISNIHEHIEVIGNIYEHPHLLEGGEHA